MRDSIQKIKNWYSDWRFRQNHDRESDRLNSELNKRYYKSNSNDIIKILTELDKKAGLSPYDIVPFLKRIGRMPEKGKLIKEGSGGTINDRHLNNDIFKELEQLEFIRILENKLFSESRGQKYKTPAEECVLKVKLLPKGIDYLIEHLNRNKDNYYKKITIWLLILASIISLPQAIYYTIEIYAKTVKKGKSDNVENNNRSNYYYKDCSS